MISRNKNWLKIIAVPALGLLCLFGQINSAETGNVIQAVGRSDPFTEAESTAQSAEVLQDALQAIPHKAKAPISAKTTMEKPELFMETVMLRFLRASNMEPVIRSMITDFGNVAVDKETNSLIVCDSKKQLGSILEQIRKADRVPHQIQIEVVIVDVRLDNRTQIGVNWENLVGNDALNNRSSQQTLANDVGTSMTYPGVKFGFAKNSIEGSLRALQETRDIEILANPTVMVVSGQDALIETVEEIPYTELTQSTGGAGTSGAITSTQFKNVGLTLTVKAIITDENRIMMTIEPQQSINTGVAGVGGSTVPIVDKRRTKTTLLMDNDQVMIMGGLKSKETRITKSKVPLLGDLPLLGFLFSADDVQKLNSELLVFISPHIRDDVPLTDSQKARLKQIRALPPVHIDATPRLEFKLMQSASDTVDNIVQPKK